MGPKKYMSLSHTLLFNMHQEIYKICREHIVRPFTCSQCNKKLGNRYAEKLNTRPFNYLQCNNKLGKKCAEKPNARAFTCLPCKIMYSMLGERSEKHNDWRIH